MNRLIYELLMHELENLITLLATYESYWSEQLRSDLNFLKKNDSRGLVSLLKKYGGWGTLNDIFICKRNGHPIHVEDEKRVNEQLRKKLDICYGLAKEVEESM